MEHWEAIEGLGGRYEVSDSGRIRKLTRDGRVTQSTWTRLGGGTQPNRRKSAYHGRKRDKELPRGASQTKWYRAWRNAQQRCSYIRDKAFGYYGGKGIECHLDWRDVRFLWERDAAEEMKQPSLDRIDPNGHYTRNNCRFIEMTENRKGKGGNTRKTVISVFLDR